MLVFGDRRSIVGEVARAAIANPARFLALEKSVWRRKTPLREHKIYSSIPLPVHGGESRPGFRTA